MRTCHGEYARRYQQPRPDFHLLGNRPKRPRTAIENLSRKHAKRTFNDDGTISQYKQRRIGLFMEKQVVRANVNCSKSFSSSTLYPVANSEHQAYLTTSILPALFAVSRIRSRR